MAAISCTMDGVSSLKRISFGATSDICPFPLAVIGIDSVLVVFIGTELTGLAIIVSAIVILISIVVDDASSDVERCSCLVLLAACFVLFHGRACFSNNRFLLSSC